jgi:demethylmenaquinone methyltransferase/2-methoxy-6-polyprenyl-1,4-benzoquinol methylase
MQHENVTPYKDGDAKKRQVQSMFDRIAHRYDLLNRLLSAGIDTQWRRKAIQQAMACEPHLALDLATGTGDMAILLARRAPDCKIIGLDLSANMLEIAGQKIEKRGLDQQITFQQGDSENMPFDDNTFDVITVAFGVRNFENTLKGLEECYRVLKPSGQLTVLEFSQPTVTPFRQLYFLYFKYVLPFVGKITSRDSKAYKYLFESSQVFPAGMEFVKILERAGFNTTNYQSLTLGICALYSGKK